MTVLLHCSNSIHLLELDKKHWFKLPNLSPLNLNDNLFISFVQLNFRIILVQTILIYTILFVHKEGVLYFLRLIVLYLYFLAMIIKQIIRQKTFFGKRNSSDNCDTSGDFGNQTSKDSGSVWPCFLRLGTEKKHC